MSKKTANLTASIIEEAVMRAGGMSSVAKELKISRQSVWRWIQRGYCPPERVLVMERLSGVSRQKLRPDLYP